MLELPWPGGLFLSPPLPVGAPGDLGGDPGTRGGAGLWQELPGLSPSQGHCDVLWHGADFPAG